MRQRKFKKCAEWLAYCLEIGYHKSQLDALEKLWMDNHDDNGNFKPNSGNTVLCGEGHNEESSVQLTESDLKTADKIYPPTAPNELLGNEANEKTVRGGHNPEVVKRMWEAESKYGNRAFE